MSAVRNPDVIIAGAGVIGLSIAVELRRAGASVLVLDRSEPAREATSAAAGMLVTSDPDPDPLLQPFAEASAELYPNYVADIEARAGLKTGFQELNALYVAEGDEQLEGEALDAEELARIEPNLARQQGVYLLPERSVDPRLLGQALVAAAKNVGVEVHHEAAVRRVNLDGAHQLQVDTAHASFTAATFINCAGAWASEIEGCAAPTRPVKGQMLAVIPPSPVHHVIRSRDVYLVPRSNGRLLIGSTVEEAGFDKTVDPKVIQRLHQAAANLVPSVGEAKIIEAWAGLRPGSPDGYPIMGAGPLPGTFMATGHFRNGILLAPITAVLMAEVIQGKSPRLDLSHFSPARLARTAA